MQDNNIIRDAINCIKILKYEIRELKVENEKLRALCDTYKTCYRAKHNDIDSKLFKYRQTLQEIKEVVEKECKDCLNKRTDSCWICPYYPILDLITKAEEE